MQIFVNKSGNALSPVGQAVVSALSLISGGSASASMRHHDIQHPAISRSIDLSKELLPTRTSKSNALMTGQESYICAPLQETDFIPNVGYVPRGTYPLAGAATLPAIQQTQLQQPIENTQPQQVQDTQLQEQVQNQPLCGPNGCYYPNSTNNIGQANGYQAQSANAAGEATYNNYQTDYSNGSGSYGDGYQPGYSAYGFTPQPNDGSYYNSYNNGYYGNGGGYGGYGYNQGGCLLPYAGQYLRGYLRSNLPVPYLGGYRGYLRGW